MTNDLKSKEQSAVFLGVSVQTINRLIDRSELNPVRIGKYVRLRQEDLESYLVRVSQRKNNLQPAA